MTAELPEAAVAEPAPERRQVFKPEQETTQPLPVHSLPADPVANDIGLITAVSDHLAWIYFPSASDDLVGERLAITSDGQTLGSFIITRVKGETVVVDGPVSSLRVGNSVNCKVNPRAAQPENVSLLRGSPP
jgi:hypothetical protein